MKQLILSHQLSSNQQSILKKPVVNSDEVVLLKADANYTEVFLENGERFVVSKTLKEFESKLAEKKHFFRTHKSYMINLSHVVSFQLHVGMTVRLSNDAVAVISRRRKDDFLAQYRNYQRLGMA